MYYRCSEHFAGHPCFVQNRDPFATTQWFVTLTCFLIPFLPLTWLYSHSYPAEVEDINSTIIGELGKTRRWYVPRIFQTSFNNFAVNSRWYSERWRGRIGKKKGERTKERDEILKLVRAHTLEIICSYSSLDLPRTSG